MTRPTMQDTDFSPPTREEEFHEEVTRLKKADWKEELEQLRTVPRRVQPGGNERERQRYLMAQQRLRNYARRGYTLETDEDGAPMPYATGTIGRKSGDPYTLPSSMPALKVRDTRTLGHIMRLWRRRTNTSNRSVARRSGQSQRFVSDLERGRSMVAFEKILTVLDALDMELLIRPRRPREPN